MFYFHGAKDGNFAIVSDDKLQINAHFIGTRPLLGLVILHGCKPWLSCLIPTPSSLQQIESPASTTTSMLSAFYGTAKQLTSLTLEKPNGGTVTTKPWEIRCVAADDGRDKPDLLPRTNKLIV
ncbi:hypothetical protein V6N13_095604 [Hibiscus sabdariffa]|uniref:Uncharacterized protein n=1 Tax=Hibiscus sabdariffa TaxID=183260 RepID=A0ABR2B6M7_9ROSI